MNLHNILPNQFSLGAGRQRISASGLFALYLQVVFFSAAYIFPTPLPAQTKSPSEYELKAAFLFNFAKFIDWPESSFANEHSPFAICVLGTDPFGPALDRTLHGKMVGNRPVTLARITEIVQARQCQVVFVAASESKRLPEIIDRLQNTSVLLVGESDGFAEAGGAIQFTLEDNRVRFTINTDVADRAGLKFSSKLLALARIVRDAPNSRKS